MFNLDQPRVGYIPPTSEQHWFSLLNPDKSPRQAFIAIRDARQSGTLPWSPVSTHSAASGAWFVLREV
jgi:hypothetical protein